MPITVIGQRVDQKDRSRSPRWWVRQVEPQQVLAPLDVAGQDKPVSQIERLGRTGTGLAAGPEQVGAGPGPKIGDDGVDGRGPRLQGPGTARR